MRRSVQKFAFVYAAISVVNMTALAEESIVISGGADVTGHNYEWTVTNRSTSPVVEVAFPHYNADMFDAPHGWKTTSYNLVGAERVPDKPSVCIAEADPPYPGILKGRSATFQMRIGAAGAGEGPGQVTVRFADGTDEVVDVPSLPLPPEQSFRYVAFLGTGAIFGLWVLLRTLRGKKRSTESSAQDSG